VPTKPGRNVVDAAVNIRWGRRYRCAHLRWENHHMQSKTLEIKDDGFVPQPQTGEYGARASRLNYSHESGDYRLGAVVLTRIGSEKTSLDWEHACELFFPHS